MRKRVQDEGYQQLQSLNELYAVHTGSRTHGLGTFAKSAIPSGYILGPVRGVLKSPDYRSNTCVALPNGDILEPDDSGVPIHQVNHSCDPNCAMIDEEGESNSLSVITLKSIAPGDELTIDYGWGIDDMTGLMACLCGSTKCRGWVIAAADLYRIRPAPDCADWRTYIFSAPSSLGGVGLFTSRDIACGELIGEVTGNFTEKFSDEHSIKIGRMGYLQPQGGISFEMLKHSREANVSVIFYYDLDRNQPLVFLQAVAPIVSGEELFIS